MDEDVDRDMQTAGRGEEDAWTANVKRLQDFSDPNRLRGSENILTCRQRGVRTRR